MELAEWYLVRPWVHETCRRRISYTIDRKEPRKGSAYPLNIRSVHGDFKVISDKSWDDTVAVLDMSSVVSGLGGFFEGSSSPSMSDLICPFISLNTPRRVSSNIRVVCAAAKAVGTSHQ